MTAVRTCAVLLAAVATLLSVSAAAPAQTATSPLSAARYTALDQSYTLEIALDRNATAASIEQMRTFCEPLDRVDPVLNVLRESCLAGLQIYPAADAASDCDSRAECLRTTKRMRVLISKVIRVLRKANRVLDKEVADRPCRKALRASRNELLAAELLRDGFRLLESALRTGSSSALDRAEGRIDVGGRISDKLPSSSKQRKTFRSACRPAPAVTPPPPAPVA